MRTFDMIVIGGGAAGLTVAAGAAAMGVRVALIERHAALGGDCLHTGCVPSKAFIHQSKEYDRAIRWLRASNLSMDSRSYAETAFADAMSHVRQSIASIQQHDSIERFQSLGVDVILGAASFVDQHTLQIQIRAGNEHRATDKQLKAKTFVIATGTRPHIPDIPGLRETGYLTNETIFSLQRLPRRLLFIGAGAIGLELGQAFERFGCEVTIVERSPHLMKSQDEQISRKLRDLLSADMQLYIHANVEFVSRLPDGQIQVMIRDQDGGVIEQVVDELVVAAGRRGNADLLGVEAVGVEANELGFVQVNRRLQTSQPHIYAAGDSIGRFLYTHAANLEGKVVVANAVLGLRRRIDYRDVPAVLFTQPEVFQLGMTEAEAREMYGERMHVYIQPLADTDRFVLDAQQVGFVKVLTDRKGRILGVHALGEGAGDWLQSLTFAKTNGHKLSDFSRVVHAYPTRAAIVQQLSDRWWRQRFQTRWVQMLIRFIVKLRFRR